MSKLFDLSIEDTVLSILKNNHYGLRSREAKMCVLLGRECKSLWEVSERMHLSIRTMEDYSRKIREKTRAQTMYQAIFKVVERIISIEQG